MNFERLPYLILILTSSLPTIRASGKLYIASNCRDTSAEDFHVLFSAVYRNSNSMPKYRIL